MIEGGVRAYSGAPSSAEVVMRKQPSVCCSRSEIWSMMTRSLEPGAASTGFLGRTIRAEGLPFPGPGDQPFFLSAFSSRTLCGSRPSCERSAKAATNGTEREPSRPNSTLGLGGSLMVFSQTASRFSFKTINRKSLRRLWRSLSVRFQTRMRSIGWVACKSTSHHGFSERSVCVVDLAFS